jgi:hypothetical protein
VSWQMCNTNSKILGYNPHLKDKPRAELQEYSAYSPAYAKQKSQLLASGLLGMHGLWANRDATTLTFFRRVPTADVISKNLEVQIQLFKDRAIIATHKNKMRLALHSLL